MLFSRDIEIPILSFYRFHLNNYQSHYALYMHDYRQCTEPSLTLLQAHLSKLYKMGVITNYIIIFLSCIETYG